MDYAGAHGLALSQFLSWDSADQDAALAWAERERETCRDCGTHRDDWDPKHGGHRAAYVGQAYICEGCKTREATDASLKEARKRLRGVRVRLARNLSLPMWRPWRSPAD